LVGIEDSKNLNKPDLEAKHRNKPVIVKFTALRIVILVAKTTNFMHLKKNKQSKLHK